METKKFELTEETIKYDGHTLYRIIALKDFDDVKKGDLGGFVESEDNLSQFGECWISGYAKVYDDAFVYRNARISNNANVFGQAEIYGDAFVYGNSRVYDYAVVHEKAEIRDNAKIYGNAVIIGNAVIRGNAKVVVLTDYLTFIKAWGNGTFITWTRSNNMWNDCCFHGTGEELIKKAYKDSEISGKNYESLVEYVNKFISINK